MGSCDYTGWKCSKVRRGEKSKVEVLRDLRVIGKKVGKQVGKDYVVFPALAGKNWKHTLGANVKENLIRNYWSYMVIFCGHFPDGAEKFTAEEYEAETHPAASRRQMLGSANFKAVATTASTSGNLCYQIEHHLFPDLPSNRYAEMSERITALCDKYDLPYTTGSLRHQYMQTFLDHPRSSSLPNKLLNSSAYYSPETHSELKFRIRAGVRDSFGIDPDTGRRRGLRTALRELRDGDVATA